MKYASIGAGGICQSMKRLFAKDYSFSRKNKENWHIFYFALINYNSDFRPDSELWQKINEQGFTFRLNQIKLASL